MNNDNLPTGDPYPNQGLTNFLNLEEPEQLPELTNFLNLETEDDRLSRLSKAKERVLDKLNSGASLQNSYTDMGNGWYESNSNKTWNDLPDKDVQSLDAYIMSRQLTTDDTGRNYFSDGTEYTGSVRRLYAGGTKDGSNDVFKLGVSRGDKPDSTYRYDPDKGGYAPGDKGIDTNKFERDVLLPYGDATMAESVYHGRKKALEGRVIQDLYANPNAKADYGGGASEYYKSREALFGAPVDVDLDRGKELYTELMKKLPISHSAFRKRGDYSDVARNSDQYLEIEQRLLAMLDERRVTAGDVVGRIGNAASGFASSFVNELLVKPADALGDLTGLYDLDTNGDTTGSVEDFFGYNSRAVEQAQKKVGKYFDIAINSESSITDKMRAIGNGMLEMFVTPEMMATSLGMIAAWASPGSLLKAAGVGAKFASAAHKVDTLVKAGKMSDNSGRLLKAKKFMELDGASTFLASQSGYMLTAVGNVNKQFEEFVQNNNGVVPEGWDKAKYFAYRLPAQILNQNIDKIVSFKIMEAPGVVKALIPAVKAMTNKEFSKVAINMSKGATVTLASVGSEAAQEYLQTSMELFNSRFGSAKFSDLDTFAKFLSDPRNVREAGIAAISGAGGAGQFEFAGGVASAFGSTVSKLAASTADTNNVESKQSVTELVDTIKAQKAAADSTAASNPTASFYSAQASDNIDAKEKAAVLASDARDKVLDGSHIVFHSDKTMPTNIDELSKLVEVFAANNPESDYEDVKDAISVAMEKRGEALTAEASSKLDKANSTGQLFANIKTMSEVASEASSGARGFSTYYSAAKAAEHAGDTKGYIENITKLEKYHQYESTKLERIKSATGVVEGKVMAEAEMLVSSGEFNNTYDALTSLFPKYKGSNKGNGRVDKITNSEGRNGFTTDIHYADASIKLRDPNYSSGTYNLISQIETEVSSMETITKRLYADAEETPTSEAVSPTVEEVVAAQDTTVSTPTVSTPTVETVVSSESEVSISEAKQQVDELNASIDASESDREEYSLPDDIQAWVTSNPEHSDAKKVMAYIANGRMEANKEKIVFKNLRTTIKSDKDKSAVVDKATVNAASLATGVTYDEVNVIPMDKDTVYSHDDVVTASIAMGGKQGLMASKVRDLIGNITARSYVINIGDKTEGMEDILEQEISKVEPMVEEAFHNLMGQVVKQTSDKKLKGTDNKFIAEEGIDTQSVREALDTDNEYNLVDDADSTVTQEFTNDASIEGIDQYYIDAEYTQEDYVDTYEFTGNLTTDPKKAVEKDGKVLDFESHKASIRALKLRIKERKTELRELGESFNNDILLQSLTADKSILDDVTKTKFKSTLLEDIADRVVALGRHAKKKFTLYSHWVTTKSGKTYTAVDFTVSEIFGKAKATGFTLEKRLLDDLHAETKVFSEKLLENTIGSRDKDGNYATGQFTHIADNPATVLIFNADGTPNYNSIEAMHAAVNEYLLRDSPNLFGLSRTDEEIAEIFGISESDVTVGMKMDLMLGGTTLKLASASVGKGVVKNLGIEIESVQARDAMITSLGMSALKGYIGTALDDSAYAPDSADKNVIKATSIDMIRGTEHLGATLKRAKEANKYIEGRLKVKTNYGKSYRKDKNSKPRKVVLHNAEYQNAPKDHTNVVNKLENTEFKFNSGNDELLTLFTDKDGKLDIPALIVQIIGSAESMSNKDDLDSYNAQAFALERSLNAYVEALDERGDNGMFFDWFIAKNHRMHLDSAGLNPQTDKQIARWFLTATAAVVDIKLDTIDKVLNGEADNASYEDMTAKTFLYAIVQAFDGVKGLPGTDKDQEAAILKSAKEILETPYDGLQTMARKSQHIGHAALAIGNIKKYKKSKGVFTSDMLLEVDGLTNGFAFRAMQFPVDSLDSKLTTTEWLEKVGIIGDDSDLYDLESMNGAKARGQNDVYISAGVTLGGKIKEAKEELAGTDKIWVDLFESYDKLPNFSGGVRGDGDLRSFIRNLMKSPTMIFGYAAGLSKISAGLVFDQIQGKGYLKGKGLVSFLTSVHPKGHKSLAGEYVVSEKELLEKFSEKDDKTGEPLGATYHKARIALKTKSFSFVGNAAISRLKNDLNTAISGLYTEPLKDTLTELFSEQTTINRAFTEAGQFLFAKFNKMYMLEFGKRPNATEQDKKDWLREFATLLPGIAGASSDDQETKLTFLKNTIEATNNNVVLIPDGGKKFKRSANTVTRTFGDPGVGPAVLTILSLDSSTLARSINEFYKATGSSAAVIPVHDAIVLGVGDFGVIEEYNKEFYMTNKNYSVAEEFLNAMNAFDSRYSAEEIVELDVRNVLDKPIVYAEMFETLKGVANRIANARETLFNKALKIGQMVGPDGTMYTPDLNTENKDAIEYLSNVKENILAVLDDDVMKKALGKAYKAYRKSVYSLIEGC